MKLVPVHLSLQSTLIKEKVSLSPMKKLALRLPSTKIPVPLLPLRMWATQYTPPAKNSTNNTRLAANLPLFSSRLWNVVYLPYFDLSEKDEENTQRSLFPPKVWNKIIKKYKKYKSLEFTPSTQLESFKDKWEALSDLCTVDDDNRLGKLYLDTLEMSTLATAEHLRILDLFREIIYQVNSKRFMLNHDNRSKISERDFVYQLWLPVFSKTFSINKEVIRIKVG